MSFSLATALSQQARTWLVGMTIGTVSLSALAVLTCWCMGCSNADSPHGSKANSNSATPVGGPAGPAKVYKEGEQPRVNTSATIGGATANPNVNAPAAANTNAATAKVDRSKAIKAGEVDDNAHFPDFCQLRLDWLQHNDRRNVVDFDPSDRRIIQVVDANGLTVPNAIVRIAGLPDRRTMADGRTMCFRRTNATAATVVEALHESGAIGRAECDDSSGDKLWTVKLQAAVPTAERATVDVCFVLDVTASMGEEIESIQANLDVIAQKLTALPGKPNVRFALVVYRDKGDSFRTKVTPFTTLENLRSELSNYTALGGEDIPEDVELALADTLKLNWSTQPNAVRVAFLIGDAPPHVRCDEGTPNYFESALTALQRGIKIFPLAASGLQETDNGEFIFRQIGQLTLARFIFISYGSPKSSGFEAGADTQSSNLDALIVDLVGREVQALLQRGKRAIGE